MTEEEIGSLEQKALKRKERLLKLQKKSDSTIGKDEQKEVKQLPAPKFRSYKPQDDKLQEALMDDAPAGNVEAKIQDQLQLGKNTTVIEELDINNLAPRKPDWDLKRDIAPKLEKLERRTQKAIAELIRERLKGQQNLAAIVNVGTENSGSTSN